MGSALVLQPVETLLGLGLVALALALWRAAMRYGPVRADLDHRICDLLHPGRIDLLFTAKEPLLKFLQIIPGAEMNSQTNNGDRLNLAF